MRLFLGLELPYQIKTQLADYISQLPQGRKGWENPHDFHLTLLFIGAISEENKIHIQERMNLIKFKPFKIEIGPIQFFNRRVMYLSLLPSEELMALQSQIEKMFPEWFDPEAKKFIPHITVKRWQRYEYDELYEAINRHPFSPLSVEVDKLALFKSEKDSENRKYHVIFRVSGDL